MRRTGSRTLAIIAAGLLLAQAGIARASDASLRADVSATQIGVGEEGVYSLTIENGESGQLTAPDFGGLAVQGPQKSQSTSIQFINGQVSQTSNVTYQWNFSAPREGTFHIGSATLDVHGERLTSRPVDITCSGQAPQRPPPRRQQFNPFDPFGGGGFPDDNSGFPDINSFFQSQAPRDSDLFVRATADKTDVYVGEQVLVSLYVFARRGVGAQIADLSVPKLDGFWSEDIDTQPQRGSQVVNNVPYEVVLIKRMAVFPLRAGDLSVDSIGVDINEQVGFSQQQVKRKTEPVRLKVKPLPVAGRPADFTAMNVGSYQLHVTVNPQTTQLGQPIQMRLTLEGMGNIKEVQIPKLSLPEGLKTYDPTITEKARPQGGRFGGTKTMDYVIVPERTGDFQIPAVVVPYFDPGRQAYAVAQTQPMEVHITAGPGGAAAVTSSGQVSAPVASNVLSGGIRPIRMDADIHDTGAPLWRQRWFWPVTTAPVAAWAVVWTLGLVAASLRRRDPREILRKRARHEANRRLRAARERLAANDPGGFHAELTRALEQFVTDKTGVAALGFTHEELGRVLVERGYQAVRVGGLVRVLEECEHARFSQAGTSAEEMNRVLEETERVLDELESAAPGRAA